MGVYYQTLLCAGRFPHEFDKAVVERKALLVELGPAIEEHEWRQGYISIESILQSERLNAIYQDFIKDYDMEGIDLFLMEEVSSTYGPETGRKYIRIK